MPMAKLTVRLYKRHEIACCRVGLFHMEASKIRVLRPCKTREDDDAIDHFHEQVRQKQYKKMLKVSCN